jgi:hypothetical protein
MLEMHSLLAYWLWIVQVNAINWNLFMELLALGNKLLFPGQTQKSTKIYSYSLTAAIYK